MLYKLATLSACSVWQNKFDETTGAQNSLSAGGEETPVEVKPFPLYMLRIMQYRAEMHKTADIFRNLFTAQKYNIWLIVPHLLKSRNHYSFLQSTSGYCSTISEYSEQTHFILICSMPFKKYNNNRSNNHNSRSD
jgi:hypothetical protein